jgi:glycosyltransferase involved in cell wall biosynthesis
MKINKKILIVSTVRNCSKYINKNINILINATDNFKTVKWLIIESDSTDNTSDILKNLQANIINFNLLFKIYINQLHQEFLLHAG